MGKEGIEPSRPYGQRILSPSCIPFHHLPARHLFYISGGVDRIRTGGNGFADRGLTTWRPRQKYFFLYSKDLIAARISLISANAPAPVSPQASRPSLGLIKFIPIFFNSDIFRCTIALLYMPVFIAGAIKRGALMVIATQVTGSSASPAASLPIIFAVAGAITMTCAHWAREICAISHCPSLANISLQTGRCVKTSNVKGVTNFSAHAVMTTDTS